MLIQQKRLLLKKQQVWCGGAYTDCYHNVFYNETCSSLIPGYQFTLDATLAVNAVLYNFCIIIFYGNVHMVVSDFTVTDPSNW